MTIISTDSFKFQRPTQTAATPASHSRDGCRFLSPIIPYRCCSKELRRVLRVRCPAECPPSMSGQVRSRPSRRWLPGVPGGDEQLQVFRSVRPVQSGGHMIWERAETASGTHMLMHTHVRAHTCTHAHAHMCTHMCTCTHCQGIHALCTMGRQILVLPMF